jgi:hypothetical protein
VAVWVAANTPGTEIRGQTRRFPFFDSQSVMVDVRILGAITHINH